MSEPTPELSARRCAICGKTSNAKHGAVTLHNRLRSHLPCFNKARKEGKITYDNNGSWYEGRQTWENR